MDEFWITIPGNLYNFHEGAGYIFFHILYGMSWIYMAVTMLATEPFRQSGIEQWYLGLDNRPLRMNLPMSGPYKWSRHPIYASFMAMCWSTPHMTYDHLFLTIGWSAYLIYGSGLKEKRLRRNSLYREYAETVPSFPFLRGWSEKLMLKIWRV